MTTCKFIYVGYFMLWINNVQSDLRRLDVGVLLDIHKGNRSGCLAEVNAVALPLLLATKWAVDVINKQVQDNGFYLGIRIYDTCSNSYTAIHRSIDIIEDKDNTELPPLLGVIGASNAREVFTASFPLQAFQLPFLVATPTFSLDLNKTDTFLTSAPDVSSHLQAIVHLLQELHIEVVSGVCDGPNTANIFTEIANTNGIRVIWLSNNLQKVISQILSQRLAVVTLILTQENLIRFAHLLKNDKNDMLKEVKWIILATEVNPYLCHNWNIIFNKALVVSPYQPLLEGYKDYFINSLMNGSSDIAEIAELMDSYLKEELGCTPHRLPMESSFACSDISRQQLSENYMQNPQVVYITKAISALSAACQMVQIEQCGIGCKWLPSILPLSAILTTLNQMSSDHKSRPKQGNLLDNKYVISKVLQSGGLKAIGWHGNGHLMLLYTLRDFQVHKTKSGSFIHGQATLLHKADDETSLLFQHDESQFFKAWNFGIVVSSGIGIFCGLWILVYVLFRICDGTLTGNQSVGLLLLVATILLYASAPLFVLRPGNLVCTARHFAYSLAYALCFGVMIMKALQLRALVALGLGGEVPTINQLLPLVFVVGIQVFLSLQWWVLKKPLFRNDTENHDTGYCTGTENFLQSYHCLLQRIYLIFLLLLAFVLSLCIRNVKRNYNEARWLTLAALFNIPVFFGWCFIDYFAPTTYHKPIVALVLLFSATLFLTLIFVPKLLTITKRRAQYKHKLLVGSESISSIYTSGLDCKTNSKLSNYKKSLDSGCNSSSSKYRKSLAQYSYAPVVYPSSHYNRSAPSDWSDYITTNPIYGVHKNNKILHCNSQ